MSLKENLKLHSPWFSIGEAKSKTLQQIWKGNDSSHISFDLTIDNYSLSQIEKIRNGSDLYLGFSFLFRACPAGQPTKIEQFPVQIEHSIPKSNWVENILPQLNYKNVALVELPQLQYTELQGAIDMLNLAWRSYSRADIDDVLVKCRKALEEVRTHIKKAGFKKQEADNYGKIKEIPDWKKFFDNDNQGDIVGTIYKKAYGLRLRRQFQIAYHQQLWKVKNRKLSKSAS